MYSPKQMHREGKIQILDTKRKINEKQQTDKHNTEGNKV
jgi:hypothetical protein